MAIERRDYRRVQTHIPSKLIEPNSGTYYPGYLENLAVDGAGFVSPEYLPLRAQLICQFSLYDHTSPLNISGCLVHIRKDLGTFYYYGIKFNVVHPEYRKIIADYIESLSGADLSR